MDGQTIDLDPQTSDSMRQRAIYDSAIASISRKRRKREATGYFLMASLDSFAPASRGEGAMGRAVRVSKFICLLFAGLVPNYLVWSVLLS